MRGAGRIPLIDCALRRSTYWEQRCFRILGGAFALGTFVDNLFSTGRDLSSAISVLNDAETYLKDKWKLTIGDDSKLALPALGAEFEELEGWSVVRQMRCLGHFLTDSGAIEADFLNTTKKMWGAYYGNVRCGLQQAPVKAQLRFLSTCVRPIAGFRWSRWPFHESSAARLDRVQTNMIGHLLVILYIFVYNVHIYTYIYIYIYVYIYIYIYI